MSRDPITDSQRAAAARITVAINDKLGQPTSESIKQLAYDMPDAVNNQEEDVRMSKTIWKPSYEHSHELPSRADFADKGMIEQCECGKYYYLFDTAIGSRDAYWTPVRWYNFIKKQKIREYERNEAQN